MISAAQLVTAFEDCFLVSFNTRLIGEAEEPLYLPAHSNKPACIYFRFDYVSSALHEVSHWCIAGAERRLLEDYGYWYEADTRDLLTQQRFEQVEVKPQAVECILHWAAGLPFSVSVDNLSMPDYSAKDFSTAVMMRVGEFVHDGGLPERAERFAVYLLAQRHPRLALKEFLKQHYENYCR